jgi:hypothetical protein
MHASNDFLSGVIEGFYGPPWSWEERAELFEWMSAWELNTYFYAPKDDLHHRALWREPYAPESAAALAKVIQACNSRGIRFIYGLSPGLDIQYSGEETITRLRQRFEQMLTLGCGDFALLFDDIPDRMHAEDRNRFGSFASAQCHVANTLFRWVRGKRPDGRFLFCPTPYCGRMAGRKYGGPDYLATIGRELVTGVDVIWTGPEIISREISVTHIRELVGVLRRKPLIWDNLFANDYDGRRFYCGPYSGRSPELRAEVSGLLINPNNEFSLNYVPLRTLAGFVGSEGEWDPRTAYLSAMQEWRPRFATVGEPVSLEDLVLFGDCYYLPYEEGPEAEALYDSLRNLVATEPASWGGRAASFRGKAARLRGFCVRMTELRDRPLFYALSRRVWELREELDLLEKYLEFKSDPAKRESPFTSDFHLPRTYRGGFVPRLQSLLAQNPDETFVPTLEKVSPNLFRNA